MTAGEAVNVLRYYLEHHPGAAPASLVEAIDFATTVLEAIIK